MKRKTLAVLLCITIMSFVGCGTESKDTQTAQSKETEENKVDTSEKWVTIPRDMLCKGMYSGVGIENPIELNLAGAKYYIVNTYNRRPIQIEDGIEMINMGEYKVTADRFTYAESFIHTDVQEDIISIIAYNSEDKIAGYSLIAVSMDENNNTIGEEKYTAKALDEIEMTDVENKIKEIFGKDMFNEALVVSGEPSGVEAKNTIFTEDVYKYISDISYNVGETAETSESTDIDDIEKVRDIMKKFMEMELVEATDSQNSDSSCIEEFYLKTNVYVVNRVSVNDNNIFISVGGKAFRAQRTAEVDAKLEEIRELCK